jgi:hypothetical protein
MTRINTDATLLLKQNYILKAKRITTVKMDGIKEYIRLKIWNDTEDHTKGMNGDRMDTNDKENQKGRQESNNTVLGKIENKKHIEAKGKQHTSRNKLKEDLQIMWHKMRLLQISERLPNLKGNCKLVRLKEQNWNNGRTFRRR